ncbi:MAG: PorP/SprF family type IX secretion system membrane protein [Cyclobacteriaceae bacterium]|nr:PorP/SprF family type IX secretion system membrane protein [Cyclobacteriaceae bacterium]
MNLRPSLLLLLFCVVLTFPALAQSTILYSSYYMNPSLYNPAFTGSSGYSELFLNFRRQWSGYEGAPTTGTLNVHLPLNFKTSLGFNAFQDKAGIIRTTSGMATFAYHVHFGNNVEDENRLSFGLSAGLTNSFLKDPDNPDDPAVANNTTYFLNGQFGLSYQLKNLNIAFGIPGLFNSYVVSDVGFNTPGFDQLKNTISSLSYRFDFSGLSFQPMVIYRTSELSNQFEALGIFTIKQLVWLGGSYRQDYGAAVLAGLQVVDKFRLGYAYEFSTDGVAEFNNGTHEIQLALRIGKKQVKRPTPTTKPEPVTTKEPEPAEEPKPEEPTEIPEPQVAEIPQPQQEVKPEPVETKPEPIETKPEVVEPEPEKPRKLNGEELPPGHYVVVGVFKFQTNAKTYRDQLSKASYPAEMAYVPAKEYYIVHLGMDPDIEKAKALRDKYRQQSRYSLRDTWILSVE